MSLVRLPSRPHLWAALLALLAFSGCALLQPLPEPTTIDERLATLPTSGLPLDAPVTVRWNDYQIPFIEAETDEDAAFALGLVHAHLRLGQMAVVRRIVQGRLSESAGPFTTELDTAIRAFDFYRPADAIYAAMPPASRRWTDRYVAGINHYAANLTPETLPHEFTVLNIAWEPWRAQDSIAIGRGSGVDLNWFFLLRLLQIEDPALRETVMARLLDSLDNGETSFTASAPNRDFGRLEAMSRFADLSGRAGRSGSNSIVVSPEKSASGAALIANDPHLSFILPNAWVIAGLRSPSYRMVGMMVAGTPVFGFGRNENVSWGGTNLRSTASQFVDVSGLPPEAFETREHDIGVRFWFDTQSASRLSAYGPVMSELDALPETGAAFAVRWTGHGVTDEVTALLGAMKAESVEDFRAAMRGFAVPPQTFLVADTDGRIASVIATKVPARTSGQPLPLIVTPEQSDADWSAFYSSDDLPFEIDPPAGFIASANNRPSADESRPYGGAFPQDERIRRLIALLSDKDKISLEDLTAVQLDVVSPLSREIIDAARAALEGWQPRSEDEADAVRLLLDWDGSYPADSRAPAVFEAFLTVFMPGVYEALGRQDEYAIYQSLRRSREVLVEDVAGLTDEQWAAVLKPALARAARMTAEGTRWGDIHRLRVGHAFSGVPVIGGRYLIDRIPVSGSRETALKTSHDLTAEEHDSTFGSQSRHLSDMADPDRNYFILLGGQDGWLNSANFADQVDLWRDGDFVQVPLRPETVQRSFQRVTLLTPN